MPLSLDIQILLVEDHLTIRKLLVNILRQQGFKNFLQADHGEAAWKILNETQVDLVIADWSMPVMDGMELLLNIRQNEKTKSIPILMITAKSQKQDVMEAIEKGANNYIIKPFEPATIIAKIQDVLAKAAG